MKFFWFCTVSPHLVSAVAILYCLPSLGLSNGHKSIVQLFLECMFVLLPILLVVFSNEWKWPFVFVVNILNWKQGKEIDFNLWFPLPLLLLYTLTLQWLQASISRMEPCTWKQLAGHFWIPGTWPCRGMTSVHTLLLPDVLICVLVGSSEES